MLERTLPNLTNCDREPIHIPGSIQPFGFLFMLDQDGRIVGYAGSGLADEQCMGKPAESLLGPGFSVPEPDDLPRQGFKVLGRASWKGSTYDAIAFQSGGLTIVELTQANPGENLDARFLADLDQISSSLERSISVPDLAYHAARIFQQLTGYGRVMVYRFLGDEAGVVIGESITDGSSSFLNHHFPGSDIPRQARALYLRNRVRVIPDVDYVPEIIRRMDMSGASVDLSDSTLRSVSPIHIEYLRNMGVAASASMSIIKDGVLWGLVACHDQEPRNLSLTVRLACQNVATALARQIRLREDGERYRARIRLRAQEDLVIGRLGSDDNIRAFLGGSAREIQNLLQADGFAVLHGDHCVQSGHCPDLPLMQAIAGYVHAQASARPLVTASLSSILPAAQASRAIASGLVAVTLFSEDPAVMLWFRAEQRQVVQWAGNPHKGAAQEGDDVILTPRKSFEAWAQQVSGSSREWLDAEVESAVRLARRMNETWNSRRIHRLNHELISTLRKNESLIQQKDFLLKEVNHRVQNSLSIVSAFLRMQSRVAGPEAQEFLAQADHRLLAVGLVHRRLYQHDDLETVDLARYLDELIAELVGTMDPRWRQHVSLNASPIWIEAERAISMGLIVNELLTNAFKYAYSGNPGPVELTLEQDRCELRLIVADRGRGVSGSVEGTGFGSRVILALIGRLGGRMSHEDNQPGLRVALAVPVRYDGDRVHPAEHPRQN